MSNATLCMYRGTPTDWKNRLGHWLVCALTTSKYSHVELFYDGVCYSSSYRDGGVRAKVITDLNDSGHWDLFPITIDVEPVGARFKADEGKPYGWRGMLRVCPLLRWLPRRDGERFCSEEVAHMLGASDPETFSPEDVLETYVDMIGA
jgi:hypothetical protein